MLSFMNEVDPCLLLSLCVLYEIQNQIFQQNAALTTQPPLPLWFSAQFPPTLCFLFFFSLNLPSPFFLVSLLHSFFFRTPYYLSSLLLSSLSLMGVQIIIFFISSHAIPLLPKIPRKNHSF